MSLGLGLFLATAMLGAEAEKSSDPYAQDPYWYKPGHSVAPAAVDAIKVAPGFVVERVLTVPREMVETVPPSKLQPK